MTFDRHETLLLPDVVGPDDIDVSFEDVGGMDEQLQEVKDNVVLPFHIFKHYRSSQRICTSPTGVLLYGAPGTGILLLNIIILLFLLLFQAFKRIYHYYFYHYCCY